jgi:peptidoglycan-associated lipoprotein
MHMIRKLSTIGCITLMLAACSPADREEEPVPQQVRPQAPQRPGDVSGTQVGTVGGKQITGAETGQEIPARNALGVMIDEFGVPHHKVFYFDYDQASIHQEDLDTVASHGQYIASSPSARVRLEGHTDERGTREYNVALGENRAKAVQRILQLQGVRPDQVSVLSYGEEQPVEYGHEADSWALNRRVEIIYESR